jgi:LacI family transcriptional regulator
MSLRRLDSVLLHRGISGVLFAASRATCEELGDLNLSRLCAVKIGSFPQTPVLHQITVDPVGVMRLAMRHILFAGYRRIGLVMSHRWDKLTDQVWSAAFHAEQYRCHLREALPILRLQCPLEEQPLSGLSAHDTANDAAALLHWTRQYRPEVVLGMTPAVLDHIHRCGFLVPQDFAYADLLLHKSGHTQAGVRVNCERVGELAVEMVDTQLQQNLPGIPENATVTSVGGSWRDGYTLPARRTTAAAPDRQLAS